MLFLRLSCIGLALCALVWIAGYAATSAPGRSPAAPAPPNAEELERAQRLARHVEVLAKEIGERRVRNLSNLQRSSQHLWDALRRTGCNVRELRAEVDGAGVPLLQGEIEGQSRPGEIVLLAAHYDSSPQSPGANDDASGCAVLVELARELRAGPPLARTVRLVFFPNGSRPWAGSARAASRGYARERSEGVVAMLAVDGLGSFSSEPKSQRRPPPLGWFHRDRADFVAFQADPGSRALLARVVGAFRDAGRMPAEALCVPNWAPGTIASDHLGFRAAGIPAVLVTDTHAWRNEHSGSGFDTPDRLDYEAMARATTGLAAVVRELAGR